MEGRADREGIAGIPPLENGWTVLDSVETSINSHLRERDRPSSSSTAVNTRDRGVLRLICHFFPSYCVLSLCLILSMYICTFVRCSPAPWKFQFHFFSLLYFISLIKSNIALSLRHVTIREGRNSCDEIPDNELSRQRRKFGLISNRSSLCALFFFRKYISSK